MMQILRAPKIDLKTLIKIQEKIVWQVRRRDGLKKLRRIAGCDISFARRNIAYAACVVLDYRTLEVLEKKVVKVKLRFPYIPTFLAFRELEGMLLAVKEMEADVYVVGAQGLAHPRRAGLACHLGVVLDKPVIGVAKSILVGKAAVPANRRGAQTPIKEKGEIIGAAVRSNAGSKPVYVSIGNKISLKTAVKISIDTTRGHRLPEPLQKAHELATEAARRL
ncbi:MAG: endonuclease V [Candidatus Hadarchaeota archaeon]